MSSVRASIGRLAFAGLLVAIVLNAFTAESEPVSAGWDRTSNTNASTPNATSDAVVPDETRRDETRRDETETETRPERVPRRVVAAVRSLPGEDELTLRWSEISADDRARELREQYVAALDEMERGANFETNRARADAAVTGLRAELYGSMSGREEHQRLERRLQLLVERERREGPAMNKEER